MAGGMSFSMGAKKGPKIAFGLKSQPKAPKPAAFAPASDSDDDVPEQDQKRQRRSSTEVDEPPPLPPPTADSLHPEELRTVEKLAEFVSKHGRSFEEVTRQRNPHGGMFKFLFEPHSDGFRYYEKRLEELATPAPQPGFLSSTPMPAPPLPPRETPTWRQPTPMAQPPPTSRREPVLGGPPTLGKKAETEGDSLAAMEAAMKRAADREEARKEKERDEEAGNSQPLLNDTSFDRRRVVAVYKEDGTRGHHMQDYIPKEELAKFLASSGSEEAKAQAEAMEAAQRIQSDNIGHKLLSRMGWKEGTGLGASGSGVAAPVAAAGTAGHEKMGLGAQDHRSVQEGDDEFETYRKRMMLGYKHRPNPLGNPRKSYY